MPLTKVTSDVISTNTISGLISQGFTSMNVATFGTQTLEFGSSNTLVFRANTSTERMRIDTAGNLLLGTTTGFTSTTAAGALKMDGYGIYPYTNTSGVTNTAVVSGLTYQNSTPYAGDNGATGSTLVAALVQAKLSNSGVGGTNSINIQAGNFGTVISNVGAAARISGIGLAGAGVRNISTDVSTDVNNQLYGVQGSATHNISAGAGIVSGVAIAGQFNFTNLNGTTTTGEALRGGVNIGNTTSSLSASATNASGLRLIMNVGAASGGPGTVTNLFGIVTQGPTIGATGTVTNYYALYLDTPSVTGTLTNRYGVYQVDASSPNYFAGNVGIGTSSPTFAAGGGLNVANGTFATMRARGGSSTGTDFAQGSDGKGYVYVRDNADLIVGTNNTERMRITAGGVLCVGGSSSIGSGTGGISSTVSSSYNISLEKPTGGAIGFYQSGVNTSAIEDVSSQGGLRFYTGTGGSITERMRILPGAAILCLSGGNTSATGTGITFPATQSASADANTLDDYEEGTWTPIATSQTGSITSYASNGSYIKIGRTVFIRVEIALTNVGSAGGWLSVSGLPFTTASGQRPFVALARENAATGNSFQVFGEASDTYFRVTALTNVGAITWTNGYGYVLTATYPSAN